jgi:hypothetical protein
MDVFEGLTELSCPSSDCGQMIAGIRHPTAEEVEAAAAAGDAEARQMLGK